MEHSRTRGRIFGALALAFVVVFSSGLAVADTPAPNFAGHYELVDTKAGRDFTLEVTMTDSRHAEISFSAAMDDGSGSAPDADGKGKIEDGVLSCKFTDSFNNEGTCTLALAKRGYEFDMVVLKVVDSRPFHFYGNMVLKKAAQH